MGTGFVFVIRTVMPDKRQTLRLSQKAKRQNGFFMVDVNVDIKNWKLCRKKRPQLAVRKIAPQDLMSALPVTLFLAFMGRFFDCSFDWLARWPIAGRKSETEM